MVKYHNFHFIDYAFNLNYKYINNIKTSNIKILGDINQEDIYKIVIKRIKKHLNNETSSLRARINPLDKSTFYYTDEDSKDLVKKIVKISKNKLDKYQLGKILIDSCMSSMIYIYQKNIYIVANHVFFDGLRLFQLTGYCLDNKLIDNDLIPNLKYDNILTEAKILKDLPEIYKNLSSPNNLSVNNEIPFKKLLITDKLKHIKSIKKYLNDKYNGFSFSSTIGVISSIYLFENSNTNKLKISIIFGFKEQKYMFNNIANIYVNLIRAENWKNITIYDKCNSIADQINIVMKTYAKSQVDLQYILNNKYDVSHVIKVFDKFYLHSTKLNNKNMCDLTVSGIKINKCSFNKNPIKISADHISIDDPCYIAYQTEEDTISFQIFNNSKDIKNIINSLQIKDLYKSLKSKYSVNLLSN